ncbi:MAG: hypothetical protein NT014_04790 [Candidatus Omnitrophica bacterium]|nr:hypothetical protein [Candidatus Omnitrophota bacterium]
MEVKSILLCDAATPHPDGTFSLLRGGIDNWNLQSFPAQIRFSFVVILELLSTEVGRTHTVELDVIDADGNRVLPQGKIPFSIPIKMNVTHYKWNLVGSLIIPITKAGKYSLQLGADGHNLSSVGFQTIQAAQSPLG